ncbi:uncharacterized protein LOC126858291 [Cataglyphis hispanica]|uniref:uncharacterized protein LOC126858291 n=1 Tax=Cataglyphis hispanica TaxID=1086592 RepID=UPI0021803026|nr:uncharacterized protein LOC126858291 [Cataglyphis hispanica]
MNDTDTLSDILSGRRPISLSLYAVGGIIIATIILTCCCTVWIRKKCARLINKFRWRKKKEIYVSPDIEEGRKKRVKNLRKKKRRILSPEVMQTEVTAPIIPKEREISENGSPTPCYKCFRKKKKRPKRQTR